MKATEFSLAKFECRNYGFTLTRKSGEYRLAPMNGTPVDKENKAYYTQDLSDAIGTAKLEAERMKASR